MSVSRLDPEYLYYLVYGSGYVDRPWTHLWGSNDYFNDHWEIYVRPTPRASDVGFVDMSNHNVLAVTSVYTQSYTYNSAGSLVYQVGAGVPDLRTADRLTLDHHGVGPVAPFVLALKGVEFVDAPISMETNLEIITKDGFTTDGTIASLTMRVGHQEMTFTGAARDSAIFMGSGYDVINFTDHLDVPGQQFWAAIRRDDGELDVYSLFSGYRVQLGGGYKGWTAAYSPLINYGEVEEILLANSKTGETDVYLPGVDLPNGGDRGTAENIDLRSDGRLHSDSFNHAYFNYIRYTSDNVWVGEATIHDGNIFSDPSDRVVTIDSYGVNAPVLSGTMSVVGHSRNGTHDLIVAEQSNQSINGNLRLYAFDVNSGLYNQFNQVFLGDGDHNISDKSGIVGSGPESRVALYGFAGNDTLKGGAGSDYLFGGKSSYDPLAASPNFGNEVWGGAGADYFGVGHTDAAGVVQFVSPQNGAIIQQNEIIDVSTGYGTTANLIRATATDRIMDWDAGNDTIVVLQNAVAIIDGLFDSVRLYAPTDWTGANTIDLRSYLAKATSDQNGSGARAEGTWTATGAEWDESVNLDHIFQNQQLRDALAIINEIHPELIGLNAGDLLSSYAQIVFDETDVTVRNDGVIVSKGGAGDDIIFGSFGSDYIYGGAGSNLIWAGPTTGSDGVDKIFIDGYFGYNEVRNFNISEDQIYLNADVLAAIRNGLGFSEITYNGDFQDLSLSGFVGPQNMSPSFGGVLGLIYEPYKLTYKAILNNPNTAVGSNGAWSNKTHYFADDQASLAMIAAGSATVAIGTAMLFNPFTAIPGVALVVAGASQIAAGLTTSPHQNAQIRSEDKALITLLESQYELSTDLDSADKLKMLDFFYGINQQPTDGFVRALEFTVPVAGSDFGGAISNPFRAEDQNSAIAGYYALHSNLETFIYRVASSDRIITDDETYLVAEVSGLLDRENLEAYLGSLDIYNSDVQMPDFAAKPTLTAVTSPDLSVSGRTSDTTIELAVTLDANLEDGQTLQLYRDGILITTLNLTDAVGGDPQIFSFVDNVSTIVASGQEEVFAYTARTVSKDGIVRSSNNLSVIVDRKAPEIASITASGENTISVVVIGSDISATEKALVSIKEGGATIGSPIEISASGTPVSLTIPASLGFATYRSFRVEVADARGNVVTDDTAIYKLSDALTNTYFEFPGRSFDRGAIAFLGDGTYSVDGTDGDEVLVLSAGSNLHHADMKGGDDTLIVSSAVGSINANGGAGVDTVDFSLSGQAMSIDLQEGKFAFIAGLTPSNANIISFENATGSQFGDLIFGNNDNNVLRGGAGNDTIDGGAGDDRIIGGSGSDVLTGGAGADVFVFDSLEGVDTITDYSVADDSIEFSASVFGSLGPVGSLGAERFLSGAGLSSASGAEHRIIYNTTTGDLFYDADGVGGDAAVLLANFTAAPSLLHSEFSVVA